MHMYGVATVSHLLRRGLGRGGMAAADGEAAAGPPRVAETGEFDGLDHLVGGALEVSGGADVSGDGPDLVVLPHPGLDVPRVELGNDAADVVPTHSEDGDPLRVPPGLLEHHHEVACFLEEGAGNVIPAAAD